jgi:NitT/TauT family transport system ATP-binding protein
MTTAAIELNQVGKQFHGAAAAVFSDVNAGIDRGEFVSIVGPSGCGKTTLLRCVGGLEEPSAGTIRVFGTTVAGVPRGCVYVFQDYSRSLFAWRRLLGNVMFPIESRLGRKRAEEVARNYIKLVGLTGAEHRYPWQLSGGMQQRAAIARALAAEAEILLMDEPFAAVDAQTRMELQDLLLQIHGDAGKTILFVTHDVDEAVYLSDRVLVLSGSPAQFVDEVGIDLTRPRNQVTSRSESAYTEYRACIMKLLLTKR